MKEDESARALRAKTQNAKKKKKDKALENVWSEKRPMKSEQLVCELEAADKFLCLHKGGFNVM